MNIIVTDKKWRAVSIFSGSLSTRGAIVLKNLLSRVLCHKKVVGSSQKVLTKRNGCWLAVKLMMRPISRQHSNISYMWEMRWGAIHVENRCPRISVGGGQQEEGNVSQEENVCLLTTLGE